ncbi:hypothetical protein ASPCAL02415 [Aspergillus calidoustus]|uniref:homogentisate 1,2-dioxygenase n=1 Tax=Aspergillus calidoustus TaxID=454130 RepID=A0A0U5GQ86_ASPCI|nr:hypothetical protein ASPCAL02415 [Aspergillus calidoustus]
MRVTQFDTRDPYSYATGLGNHETEALKGALPIGHNSPQKAPYGLYAEKISGTAFTAPRAENKQAWVYRVLPSCAHSAFEPLDDDVNPGTTDAAQPNLLPEFHLVPNQTRWDPFDLVPGVDWVRGLRLLAGAGDPATKTGVAYYVYTASQSMGADTAFYSADGDFLIVPQTGALDIETEMGRLFVRPMEICVIPRGIRYRVSLHEGVPVRGYILELFQGHFSLPELGPIGSNCLANERDFQVPVASYRVQQTKDAAADDDRRCLLQAKFGGRLFQATQKHTPFDVAAWHGTYYPFKYDLGRFNTIGTISYDHPDPSIYTVLTATTNAHPGTAVADLVIFPPRWLVGEDTFRPPSYHRNVMSEFMGLIAGDYIAKGGGKGGFQPAGASLHNVMSSHGPDAGAFEKATNETLVPDKVGQGSMAFMFESCYMMGVTDWGLKACQKVQEHYSEESWDGLKIYFDPCGRPRGE